MPNSSLSLHVVIPASTPKMLQSYHTTHYATNSIHNKCAHPSKVNKKINKTENSLRDVIKIKIMKAKYLNKKVISVDESEECNNPAPLVCHVCGDKAGRHSYYGGQACTSCRAFFRRAVQTKYNLAYFCVKDKKCDIYLRARKACQYCRYQACLAAGMKTTWVLNEEEKEKFLRLRGKNKNPTHVFKEPLPPPVLLQPLHYLSDAEVVEVEMYIRISGYFNGSKVTDLGTELVRELIR